MLREMYVEDGANTVLRRKESRRNVCTLGNGTDRIAGRILHDAVAGAAASQDVALQKRARSFADDVFVFGLGVVLWLLYGIGIRSPAVITTNSVSLVLVVVIYSLALHYEHSRSGRR
jgi:hypothetical protein